VLLATIVYMYIIYYVCDTVLFKYHQAHLPYMYPQSSLRASLLTCRFSEQTYSFWGHVWAHLDDFINPLFSPAPRNAENHLLLPVTDIPQLRWITVAYHLLMFYIYYYVLFPLMCSFWKGLYCRYPLKQHVCELTDAILGSLKQQNTCLTEHIKFLQQVKVYTCCKINSYCIFN
jgi:hypothetical protein